MNDPERKPALNAHRFGATASWIAAFALLLFAITHFSAGAQEIPATPVASVTVETPAPTEITTPEMTETPVPVETFVTAVDVVLTTEPELVETPGNTEEQPDTMTELVENAPDDNVEIVDIEDVELAPAVEAQLEELAASNDQISVAAVELFPVVDSPENVVAVLVGDGITFSNIGYIGAEGALGTFTGGSGIIGFEGGIILSTGSILGVVGPNDDDNATTINDTAGDADLTELVEGNTRDAAVLTFDFVPQGNTVVFNYVFTSEEYNEYVNTQFNDVFAFYINGENCATVDGGRVSVNSINNGNPYGSGTISNPDLYINNVPSEGGAGINTQMDGLTVVLTCQATVEQGQTNTIKLAIADTGDTIYDSNVFIQAKSFTVPTPTPTATATGTATPPVTATATATAAPSGTATATAVPTETATSTSTLTPGETAIPATATESATEAVYVTGLPNTGTGQDGDGQSSSNWLYGLLISAMVAVVMTWRLSHRHID